MITKIDHLGVAVRALDEALAVYTRALGLELKHIEVVEEQKVKVAFLPVGESSIELLEPTDPDGPVGKHIATRGEGMHHLALRVDDIEQALERARAAGLHLVDEVPRTGAGGAKIAFIHPRSTHGLLIELCQKGGKP